MRQNPVVEIRFPPAEVIYSVSGEEILSIFDTPVVKSGVVGDLPTVVRELN